MVGCFCLFQARRGGYRTEARDADGAIARRNMITQLSNSLLPNTLIPARRMKQSLKRRSFQTEFGKEMKKTRRVGSRRFQLATSRRSWTAATEDAYATARRFCLTSALDDLGPFRPEPRFTFRD